MKLYDFAGEALALLALISCGSEQYDVIIIGGGASGCTAGIQAASMGSRTLIVEELPWLAVMTDCLLNPFEAFDVDIYGNCL
ncbi:MAG: FAD-dependent oxidoreductase [Candidatus Cryptobacteroides sp.]